MKVNFYILDDDELDFFVMLDANLTLVFQSLDKKKRERKESYFCKRSLKIVVK